MRKFRAAVLVSLCALVAGGSGAHALQAPTEEAIPPAVEDITPDWGNPAASLGDPIAQLDQNNLRVMVNLVDTVDSLPFDVTLDNTTGSYLLLNVTFQNVGSTTISLSDTPEVYVYPSGTTEFTSENRQTVGWSDIGVGQGTQMEEFFAQIGLSRFALNEEGQAELAQWSGTGIMGGWLPLEPGDRIGYGLLVIDDGEASKVFELSQMPSEFLSEQFHVQPEEPEAGEEDDS